MFTEIVVPLDGSALAERSLDAARTVARATGARLRLVRPLLSEAGGAEWPPAGPREAYRYLDRVAGDLAAEGIAAEAIVHPGDAEELVLEELYARRPDLLILPLPVHAGLRAWVAAAEATLARTTVPLLLVPSWSEAASPPIERGRHLLVPLDGTPLAETVLPFAATLAAWLSEELVLLHAVAPLAHEGDAERYLRQIARRAPLADRAVRVDVRPGCPVAAITTAGREYGATMTVMALDRAAGGGDPASAPCSAACCGGAGCRS
jgi:nucleotide-binding universal stress UspA family protein